MNLGPQAQRTTEAARRWAQHASVVKQVGSTELFLAASPTAWRLFRWRFDRQDLTDPVGAFNRICAALNGYRHPLLLVEVYNELPKESTADQIAFYLRLVPMFTAIGVKVIGPCWGTGDYGLAEWAAFRAAGWCGFFAIALHAYWGEPPVGGAWSTWNALRWRRYDEADLDAHPDGTRRLIFISECGRDRVQDGRNGTFVGAGGYVKDRLSPQVYAAELNAYGAQLLPHEFATPFVCGPEADQVSYDMDPVVPFIATEVAPMPSFTVGPGVARALPLIGPWTESETYDAPGTDHEVSKVATPKGYATWSKATNETLCYVNDGRIYADGGNHGHGALVQVRPAFP